MKKKIEIPVLLGDGAAEDVVESILSLLLILPIVKDNINFSAIDWSLENRYKNPRVIQDGANAIAEHKIAIKVPGITPDIKDIKNILGILDAEKASQVLKEMPSPNGPLRKAIGPGGMFRQFNSLPGFLPWMRRWDGKIIHLARMHVGDEYGAAQMHIKEAGDAELVFSPRNGQDPIRKTIRSFNDDGGVLTGYGNDWPVIIAYARTCFGYALKRQLNVRLGTKNTILKIYDEMFVAAFSLAYSEVKGQMDEADLKYEHRLVDAAATLLGMNDDSDEWLHCLKNFAGDLVTDLGSFMGDPGMITSEIISEDGSIFVAETGHGTITKERGNLSSLRFNPYALVHMFAKAIEVAGARNDNPSMILFGQKLRQTATETLQKYPSDTMAALRGYPHGNSTQEYLQMLSKSLSQ